MSNFVEMNATVLGTLELTTTREQYLSLLHLNQRATKKTEEVDSMRQYRSFPGIKFLPVGLLVPLYSLLGLPVISATRIKNSTTKSRPCLIVGGFVEVHSTCQLALLGPSPPITSSAQPNIKQDQSMPAAPVIHQLRSQQKI